MWMCSACRNVFFGSSPNGISSFTCSTVIRKNFGYETSNIFTFRKFRTTRTQKVLFNLAIALLCADIIFLVGINRTGNEGGCVAVAALLHYFLLVAFSWMLVEAILQVYIIMIACTWSSRWEASHVWWKLSSLIAYNIATPSTCSKYHCLLRYAVLRALCIWSVQYMFPPTVPEVGKSAGGLCVPVHVEDCTSCLV